MRNLKWSLNSLAATAARVVLVIRAGFELQDLPLAVITKNWLGQEKFENTEVHFIPLEYLEKLLTLIQAL